MAFAGTGKIWMNGKLVEWKDANIHVASHVIHYGSGVFEGARVYDTPKGSAILRLDAHMARLIASAKIYRMDCPVHAGAAREGGHRHRSGQRLQGLLHPPAHVSRLRRARREPAALPGRRRHHGVGMGRLPRRRRAREGRRRVRELVEPDGAEHVSVAVEDERQLRERGAHPHGSRSQRLQRRHRARHVRLRQRRQRREHLHRPQRRHPHAAAERVDSARHHARHGDSARARISATACRRRTSRARCSTSPTRSSSSARRSS